MTNALTDYYTDPASMHRPEGRLLFSAGNGFNGDCPLASLEALYDEAYRYGSITASRSRLAAPGRP